MLPETRLKKIKMLVKVSGSVQEGTGCYTVHWPNYKQSVCIDGETGVLDSFRRVSGTIVEDVDPKGDETMIDRRINYLFSRDITNAGPAGAGL